jgi:AAA domain, putative AbiEii toxin, Type IV TA system
MLNSLEIRNYRNIKHLTISKLSRVNLFVGMNNTGKTSVLEALAIYINHASIAFIAELLEERGENYIRRERSSRGTIDLFGESPILKTLSAIFSNRIPGFSEDASITIGELEMTLFGPSLGQSRVAIRFVRYIEELEESGFDQLVRKPQIVVEANDNNPAIQIGLEIKYGRGSTIIPLLTSERFLQRRGRYGLSETRTKSHQFIRTKNIDRDINGSLWDSISLTEREEDVVNALRIIESKTERLTFRNEGDSERVAVIKLKLSNDIIPLRSMGDGINRVLTIILAMVNCENGYLLIDEFENGLHFSVQEKLWEIVFHLAERLNIQVFATTHSSDTVNSFATVLANQQNPDTFGHIIRLQQHLDRIIAVDYTVDELEAAVNYGIEIRG